ncbi:MAG: winged helix-turn-helix domain-containing protein [Promethearchaeota archaeon]
MSGTEELNYPPEEIYVQLGFQKKNIEHIILWMLKNNEIVEWSNFKEDPINIAQSTLSNYLNKLDSKGYIEKIKRGHYKITSKGEERYNELSRAKEAKRKLSYPPKAISDKRNYDHIILWMAYNNNYLKWSDFLDERAPVYINQSSLSKNLNLLMDNGLIRKENKEYRITLAGKSEYSRMLKSYDLDRQSILNEESKRIEEITKRTIRFFEKYDIVDDDIKFRFLNNVLTLPFEKLKGSLDSEEDFNKILLFLSMNHPNQYPFYKSTKDFSKKYNIDILDLEFNIRQIVEKNVYPIEFFRLEVEDEKIYYFQANEKIEKVLSAITEDHITKFTYLNKLYEKITDDRPILTLESTVDAILNEICDNLFVMDLKEALKKFLPEYINYLAYKIETKRTLVDTLDKLEGVAWRNIPEVFQSISSQPEIVEQTQKTYYIDPSLLRVLTFFASPKIEELFEEAKYFMKKKEHEVALNKVNAEIELDKENIDLLFLKAIVLSYLIRHQEAIELLNTEVKPYIDDKDENSMISYYFISIFCHLTYGRFEKAFKLSNKLSKTYPDHPISYATRALILGQKIIYELDLEEMRSDQVLDDIDHAISLDSNKSNKAKYFLFKSLVLNQLNELDDAIEAINTAMELDPKDLKLFYYRYKMFFSKDDFEKATELIEKNLKKFPEKEVDLLLLKANLMKKMNRFDESLKIVNKLREKYPDNLDILNHKVYYHLYNNEKEEAINAGKLLTELDPDDGNYHDTFAEILTDFGEYEKALKEIQKALELEPYGWFTYNSYLQMAKCYKETEKYDLARESLEEGEKAIYTCFCDIKMRKEWKEKKIKLLAEMDELEVKF